MNPGLQSTLSRRDAIKTVGGGAALLGLGVFSQRSVAAAPESSVADAGVERSMSPPLMQPFALPKLAYAQVRGNH